MSDTPPPSGDPTPGGAPTPPPAPGAVPPPPAPGGGTPPPPAPATPPPPAGATPPPPGEATPPPPGGATPPPPGGATPPPPGGATPPPPGGPTAPPPGATPPPVPPAYGATAPPGAPYVPPPAGGAARSNGIAIAALVLGIISVLCLGPIAGIVAVVLGVVGMKKANEVGNGRGMAIAGLVLGAVGTVLWIVGFIVLVGIGNEVSNNIDDAFGTADPSDYEIVTKTCEVDRYGFVTFDGTIENTASRDLDFTIDTEIRDTSDGSLVDSPSTVVYTTEGDTVSWEVTGSVPDSVTEVECKVTDVNNFGNF